MRFTFDHKKPALVEKFIQRIGIDNDVVFTVTPQIGGEIEMACSSGKNKCTPEIAFADFYGMLPQYPTPNIKHHDTHNTKKY